MNVKIHISYYIQVIGYFIYPSHIFGTRINQYIGNINVLLEHTYIHILTYTYLSLCKKYEYISINVCTFECTYVDT